MIVKPVKKLTKWQLDKLPELYHIHDRSTSMIQLFTVWDGDILSRSSFVGAMLVAFTAMTIRQGHAYFDLFIEKFEVTRKYKGTGYGRRMYQWLESNYRINIIELEHMSEFIDKGASHRFWLHMGFHKPSAVGSLMCKRISGR